jgi:peptide/nickel transport system substrate-binding protein
MVFTDPKVGSPTASLLANIDSISVRDSLTAVAWFKHRKPEQFYDLAYQLVVVPEHIYGSIAPDQLHTSDVTRHPVGSGRFRLEKWDAGTRISLVADTANYRGRPKLDRVIFTPMDPAGAAAAVLTGQLDVMDNFPFAQLPRLDSSTVARPVVYAQLAYAFAAMNANARKSSTAPHPIFSDKRVRRALSMAVDRVAMLRNVFGDKGRLNHGPFPMTLAVADSTTKVPPYDTVAANALLDSAGWRRGPDGMRARAGQPLRFTIATSAPSIPRNAYAVLMQEAFRRVGARADIERLEPNAMNDRVTHGDFDMVLLSFGTDPSPTDTKQFWATSAIGPTGQNYYHYSNRAADALMDSLAMTGDPVKSRAYASRAFKTIVDDVPAIWLYDGVAIEAVNGRITTAPMRADEWWANLADWSIAADKRIDRDRIGLTPAKP